MTGFDEFLGQRPALELLQQMLESGRVPHAMLFHGPEGVGKSTAARTLAAALLCESAGSAACGHCEACRLVDADGHPDLWTVVLQPKKESASQTARTHSDDVPADELKKFISVDQVRELSRFAGLAPRSGPRRLFLIDPADRMNHEAQNALLKTLEEPPGQAVLVLVASRPQILIPTVRSRCFALGFSALPSDELARLLEQRGIPAAEALQRAALAEGRPGRALALDVEAARERRDGVLEMLETLAPPRRDASRIAGFAAELAGRDEPTLIEGLELLQALLRDAARAAGGDAEALIHADVAERLAGVGRQLGASRAASLIASLDRLRGELRFNLNRTLIAEALLAAIAGGPLP